MNLPVTIKRLLASAAILPALASAGDWPDQPGTYPNRDYVHQQMGEKIDPFNGNLQLNFVDGFVPGNGGFDLKIQRHYNALTGWTANSPYGGGWDINFGRVHFGAGSNCSTGTWILDAPDGSHQTLYPSSGVAGTNSSTDLISVDFWKGSCDAFGAITIWSPDGTRYDMQSDGAAGFVTKKITDRNGNHADLTYTLLTGWGQNAVSTITTSDGHGATFYYGNGLLTSIVVGGRTWTYSVTVGQGGLTRLASVTPPTGTAWTFTYGSGALISSVKNPQVGTTNYTYTPVNFLPGVTGSTTQQAVSTKTSTLGTWTFAYTPATQVGSYDQTVVTLPSTLGKITYKHFGANAVASNGNVWKIGSLYQKITGASSEQTETFTWTSQLISNQVRFRYGYVASDPVIYRPLLASKAIQRDGGTFTTNYTYDTWGNASSSSEIGSASRTRNFTYFNDSSRWIVGMPLNETIVGVGTIARTRSSTGNLLSETRFGVQTTYTYLSDGSIATKTDARNKLTTFATYSFGIPTTETRPDGVVISRYTDTYGNVRQESDGEATWNYQYDGLNRVTFVDHPKSGSADATITWTDTTRNYVRGAYSEFTQYDAFGRISWVTRGGVQQNFNYDALGRKLWETVPGSSAGAKIFYTYDALGRLKSVASPAGTKNLAYGPSFVTITNERNLSTTYTYARYGDPDQGSLTKISSPESIVTDLERDDVGTLLSATQSGSSLSVKRTYHRDSHLFIDWMDDPEIGHTDFVRDAVGNATTKTVGGVTTTYTYDGLNRVKTVANAGTSTFTYDGRGKVTVVDGPSAKREYQYDDNGGLIQDKLTIDQNTFVVGYAYDTIDGLDSITYPLSKGTVTYTPDKFGRPTKASPYLTGVSHFDSGNLHSISYANGVAVTLTENSDRQLPLSISASGIQLGLTYSYDEVGNVTLISNSSFPSESRTLTYDGVDRLKTASGPWGSGSFVYSTVGNIVSQQLGSYSLSYTYASNRLTSISGSRSMSLLYDTRGNVTGNGQSTFDFDNASQLTCANCNTLNEVKYQYDGQNRRVSEEKGGRKTYFIQAPNGDLQFEYTPIGKTWTKHAYLKGKRVASETDSDGAPSAVSLSATPSTFAYGSSVTLTATVSPAGGGTVEFRDGATLLGATILSGGTASLTLSTLSIGDHAITANYSGDNTYQPSSSASTTVSVTRLTPSATLSAGLTNATLGQQVGLTVTFSGGSAPTGTVQFSDGPTVIGTVAILSGGASLSTQPLSAGTHTITARYSGDSNNDPVDSNAVDIVITQGQVTVAVTTSNSNSLVGRMISITATVSGYAWFVPSGTVQFFDGGALLLGPSQLINGTTWYFTSMLSPGTHQITASYSGDANYPGAVSPAMAQIIRDKVVTTTSLSVVPVPVYANQPAILNVTINGDNPAGPAVHIMSNGVQIGQVFAYGGTGSGPIGLPIGTTSMYAVYDGDASNTGSTSAPISMTVRPGQQPQDLNLDGKADLLWFRPSDRSVTSWQMNGAQIDAGSPTFGQGAAGTELVDIGDFDGDGRADLLWFRASDRMWLVQLFGGSQQSLAIAPSGWILSGVGDFNGDGKTDLLWFDPSDRTAHVWWLSANQVVYSTVLGAPADAGYVLFGAADLDAHLSSTMSGSPDTPDGKVDILWYRPSDRMVRVQLTDGATQDVEAGPVGGELRAVGDVNGDGRADLIWYSATDRAVTAWIMNGAQKVSAVTYPQGAVGFEPIGAADFDGDGKADILWYRSTDGMVAIQFTNGAWTEVDTADPGFELRGLGDWDLAPPAPSGSNVALSSAGAIASGSSLFSRSFTYASMNNGDRKGVNYNAGGTWKDANTTYPDWVQVIFSGSKTINGVIVYSIQDNTAAPNEPTDTMTFTANGLVDFTVQGWNGTAWVVLGTVTGNSLVKRTVNFAPFTTDRIRVNITNALGGYSQIAEIEAFGN